MSEGKINIINREEYGTFKPSPRAHYLTKTKINRTKVRMIDHEKVYKALAKQGNLVDVTSSEIYINGNQRPINGIFSPMFGADATQDTPIYSCDCGKLSGGANRGKTCPECGTECRSVDADLRTTMYIDIAPFHILTYHGYNAFCKIFKNFNTVLNSVKKINAKGKIIDDGIPTIMSLYEDYDEKYKPLTGLKKGYAFTSKIPVYSARLRPLMHQGVGMTILDVNKYYLSAVKTRNILKTSPQFANFKHDIEIQKTLNQIQQDFLGVIGEVLDQIAGKKGAFRIMLASGRVDNSSRMVITLGTDLMAHEVDIPYQTMMVLYEEEIANYLSKLDGIPISKAISLVKENQQYRNDKFVKIINQFLRSGYGVWALINRNPTISESGILYVRVRKIHEDTTDMSMHMPPDILGLLAADFDGDQLTFIAVKSYNYHRLFMTMCPSYSFIDRADGKVNGAMDFKKDYSGLISAAWDIDTKYDRYLNNPEADTYETLKSLGLDTVTNDESRLVRDKLARDITNGAIKGSFAQRYGGEG